jgi:hypothetical protein
MEFLGQTCWELNSISLGIVTNSLMTCIMQISWRIFLTKLHIILRSIFKNVMSCPNKILTSYIGNFWYFKTQLCFMHHVRSHLHVTKNSWNSNRLWILKKINSWVFNNLSVFKICLIIPYHPKRNHCKKVFIFEVKGPFIKWKYLTLSLSNFNGPLIQTSIQVGPISDSIYIFSDPN